MENDKIKDYVFAFECSVGWENLEKTDDEKCRFCPQCDKNVFFVTSQTELNTNARKGNCVAFQNPDPFLKHLLPVGQILPLSSFIECKDCKQLFPKGDDSFARNLCFKCQIQNPPPKKSWWQFWK
jgi:hypothetical protein